MTTGLATKTDRRIDTGVQAPDYWQSEAQRLIGENNRLREKIKELNNTMSDTDTARNDVNVQDRALQLYGESETVKSLTRRLQFLLPNATEIGDSGVAMVAQIAVAHGLDPLPGSDHVYAWKQGDSLRVTIGYKGLLHLARQQVYFTYQSRPMANEEREEHGLIDKEVGYVTTIYEIAKVKECRDLNIPYHPVVGVAKWKPKDRVPESKTPAWVAKKNSLKDALRQITSTGQRMQSALDAAFIETARKMGMEAAVVSDGIVIEVPANPTPEDVQGLIESGAIQPDMEDGVIIEGELVGHWPTDTAPKAHPTIEGAVSAESVVGVKHRGKGTILGAAEQIKSEECATDGCANPADPDAPHPDLCTDHAKAKCDADQIASE